MTFDELDEFSPPITTGLEQVDVDPFAPDPELDARLDEFQRVRDGGYDEAQTAYIHGRSNP